jgi:hypothetical protein
VEHSIVVETLRQIQKKNHSKIQSIEP